MTSSAADSLLANIRVVLVNTQHPGNIGSAARAMLTMGLAELVLVNPSRFPHPQARMTAAHAEGLVDRARVVATLAEAIADCGWVVASSARPRHLGDEPLPPWDMASRAISTARAAKVAVVFGCERTGLTNEELQLCHAVTMIPANPGYSSLNLSQAVQVLAYELRRTALPQSPPASGRQGPAYAPPSNDEIEHFYRHLERILLSTGFLDPANPRLLMRRLRQFFNRAGADRNELNILRGILTSIEKPRNRRVPLDAAVRPGD
ncbi:MAG: RNA methyltransferase [Solimonas sp.]